MIRIWLLMGTGIGRVAMRTRIFFWKRGATAIFCMNDFMAGGTYDRLEELGLHAGKDVAVAGYDNREMACYEKPPLTTMALPLHDIIKPVDHYWDSDKRRSGVG